MGFFNPQMADQSLGALELMEFDGIEAVRDRVQQGQTMLNQLMMMQEQMNKLGMIVYQLTGQDVVGIAQNGVQAPASPLPAKGGESSMGKAQKDAQTANMTAYGERLAARAKPDMNSGESQV